MSAQWFALTWINPHPAKLISRSVLGSPPAKRACLSVLRPPPHWQVFMPTLTPPWHIEAAEWAVTSAEPVGKKIPVQPVTDTSQKTTEPSRPKGWAKGCTVSRDRWCNSCTLFPWLQRRLRRGGGPTLLRRSPRALGRSRPGESSGRLRRARHTILAGRWQASRP